MPDQNPSGDQEGKPEPPVKPNDVGGVENDKKSTPTTTAANQEKQNSDRFFRRASLTIDFLVLIAVAIYSVFAALQWLAMRAQLSEMKESKYLSRLDQRAWVGPTSVSGTPEEGKPYKIKVEMRNSGKTFAKRVKGVALVKSKELSSPDPDFASEEERENIGSPAVLAPNAMFTYNLEVFNGQKLTKEHMEFLRSPVTVILVFGKIIYWDIFECEHWTTFCVQCTTDGECHTYGPNNDADDNRCL